MRRGIRGVEKWMGDGIERAIPWLRVSVPFNYEGPLGQCTCSSSAGGNARGGSDRIDKTVKISINNDMCILAHNLHRGGGTICEGVQSAPGLSAEGRGQAYISVHLGKASGFRTVSSVIMPIIRDPHGCR